MTSSAPPPGQTYLAKDYASFRALMLDHLARSGTPAPQDVASLEIALIEGLAYIGDYLSYYQDAVATETYMRTARQRVSVARHARLLGYRLVEGCSARTLLHFTTVADDVPVPRGTTALTAIPGPASMRWDALHVPPSFETGPAIPFETLHPLVLTRAHNRMELAPTTPPPRAGDCAAVLAGHLPRLSAGDMLVLCQESNGCAHWGHAIQLLSARPLAGGTTAIAWHPGDALPADTPVGGDWAVLGNMALADHGRAVLVREAITIAPSAGACPREAVIECRNLTYAVPYDPADRHGAQSALRPDPQAAQPALWLTQALPEPALRGADWPYARWTGRRDILRAGPDALVFAVEALGDDAVRLRFGDGDNGCSLSDDFAYIPTFRAGCGGKGNIGAGTIAHVVAADPLIIAVTNPLPAYGGVDPETLDFARVNAVAKINGDGWQRCVTQEDYAAAAALLPDVETAHAEHHAEEGGRRVVLSVTRASGDAQDPAWQAMLLAALSPMQLLGDVVSIVVP